MLKRLSIQGTWSGPHTRGALIVLVCFVLGFGAALAQPVFRPDGLADRAFGIAVFGPLFLSLATPLGITLSLIVGLLLLCNLYVSRMVRNGPRFVIASYVLIGLYWAFLMNLTAYVDYVGLAH